MADVDRGPARVPGRAPLRRGWLLAVLAALLPLVLAAAGTEVTVGTPTSQAPAPEDLEVPTEPVDLGVQTLPLRFETRPGAVLTLEDDRRFLDTIEIRRGPDGDQVLVNDVTLDDYVAGVAEMPGRWPLEALKAQAVAARTYAWYSIRLGTFERRGVGYDICDTVDCQVFRGAAQEEGRAGRRWRRAVDETTREVLVDDAGAPILARYFSTSGGRTLPNEAVFPSSGARPYLVGIEDPQDAVSPFHEWEVRFTPEQFDRILSRGERLAAAVPVAGVERLGALHDPNVDLLVTGEDGTEVRVAAVELRRFVSAVAPELFPGRFPSQRSDGMRPLPATLPSARFEVEVADDEVVVTGRGWGHAVGLGQYGARGRAEEGDTYDDILAAYYNGLRPVTAEDAPERVRVGVSQARVGSVRPDRPATIRAGDQVVVREASGTWEVSREGSGIRLLAPPGWGAEPQVSATATVDAAPVRSDAVAVTATTTVPGLLALVVRDEDDTSVLVRRLGAVDAGIQQAVWDLTDHDLDPVPSGTYQVALELTPAGGDPLGGPLAVRVERPAAVGTFGDGPVAALVADGGSRLLVVGLAAALLALGLWLVRRARSTGGARGR